MSIQSGKIKYNEGNIQERYDLEAHSLNDVNILYYKFIYFILK